MFSKLPTIHRAYLGDRALPTLTPAQSALAAALRRDVEILATDIGPRSTAAPRGYTLAAEFLESALRQLAAFEFRRETFTAHGVPCHNLEATLRGTTTPDRIIVLGAHYDSVGADCPAANDNATGVAAALAIARALAASHAASPLASTVRIVLFANEEPPHFLTETMGSFVYARGCAGRGENITAMLCPETMGCFSTEPRSQRWPPSPVTKFLPNVGNFILCVGNTASRPLVKAAHRAFTAAVRFPIISAAVPPWAGEINWSDHWSFYRFGYPALLITDTALFRYPHYHLPTDTPDKVDFDRLALLTEGFLAVTRSLASV